MPRKRQPREIWDVTRRRIYDRDGGVCFKCQSDVALSACHIDHIKSGKMGTNHDFNLRVLCRRCHVLRSDLRHRGMIAKALADGIIDSNWRSMVWDDNK